MIKHLLDKISKLSIITLVILISSTNVHAVGNKISTFETTEVSITNQRFVFMESYGSIEDNFDDIFREVKDFISQNGATSYRKAILYLDYSVAKTNPNIFKSAINIDGTIMSYLKDTYGESTLKSYRKVLVGYLVPPTFFINKRDPFKEYVFKGIRVQTFQSMDKDEKTPISVIFQNAIEQTDESEQTDAYTKPHRLFDKVTMLNYLNLTVNESKYIGMMEMYDEKLKVYTFMAIPGNIDNFKEIATLSTNMTFQRRPEVEIKEEKPGYLKEGDRIPTNTTPTNTTPTNTTPTNTTPTNTTPTNTTPTNTTPTNTNTPTNNNQ